MKEELKKYLDRLLDSWQKYNKSYPRVPWNEDILPILYIGEMDEEEYISWKSYGKIRVY